LGLERLFWAKSVAVVGASAAPQKLGHVLLRNLIEGGFAGPLYPVNRKESEVMGLRAYSSLLDVEGEVDLVVVAVPAGAVLSVIDEAVAKKAGAAIIVSGGFREAGNIEGERELLAKARAGGLRIVGPNCQGLLYTPNRLNATWPVTRGEGPIAVVSQSGTVAAALAGWAAGEGIGVTAALALGNKIDVTEGEAIDFLASDGRTRAIAVYSEGLGDGKKFMALLSEATKRTPVVVLRGGRTPTGHAAAQTHTKSLAGLYEVFAGLAEAAGAVVVNSLEELYDAAKALATLPRPSGPRVCIVTSSGGAGVLATDAGFEAGLGLAQPAEGTMVVLRDRLPSYCSVRNPMDLTGDATADLYETVLQMAASDPGIDSFLVIFGDPIAGAAEVIGRARTAISKPIAVAYLGGGEVEETERRVFAAAGIPVYPSSERAMKGLGYLERRLQQS
jgi:acyl-CoA synthetase (NDP forming)